MSALGGTYPVPAVGALGHPGFAWADLEPAQGVFDFSLLDAYAASAGQHGLIDPATNTAEIVFTLSTGTPAWAGEDPTLPPDSLQDWKDFVTALVQHFNGTDAPHIRNYELWNEANNPAWWTGSNAQMLALAKAAYSVVHQDRYSQLLTPSVAGQSAASWLTSYLQGGGAPYADGGAFHGYLAGATGTAPFPMPEQDTTLGCGACYGSIATIATKVRSAMDSWGLAGRPLLETEGSWGAATLSSDTQTAWLARYLLLLSGLRATLNLQMANWFAWSPPGSAWGDLAGAALEPTLAGAALEPTPAGIAWSQIYNWLVGAGITKPCASTADGTWSCQFTRPGGYVAQAVWNTRGYINYTPGLSYVQYRDLTGRTESIAPDAFIDVGPHPVLIEGAGTAPVISLVANAAGETPEIAPNTWVEIKGMNLARAGDSRIWQGSDFVNNQMPRQLDGVSATVNGKGAFVYYISPAQIDILTPPDALGATVTVQVTVNGIATPSVTVRAQAVAPSFFVAGGGPYAAAEHADGKILTTAAPGETIVLYGNGFGPVDPPVQSGIPVQSGALAEAPSIQIGGVAAQVVYAGLAGPGLYQFNVVVPANVSAGDQPLAASYKGFATQPGILIRVQP
jgi:uncharacterized protein (TIGR03437 family)